MAYLIVGKIHSPEILQFDVKWIFADFLSEAFGSFLYVIFIHMQYHEDTRITDNDIISICVISTVFYLARMFTVHSGGCLNPALAVSLQIFRSWEDSNWERLTTVWIFVFGPQVGSIAASQYYRSFFRPYYKTN